MIKKAIHTAMALVAMAVLSVSCQEDKWLGEGVEVPDGYVALSFSARIPAMEEVMTRAVDPDGGGVQDMSLFCFDSYGLFITTVRNVTVTEESALTGTCTVVVPENTRTIHFLANQNLTDFQEDHFRNKSEAEVVALLEGSSGRMIYWARFACKADDERSIKEQMADETVNPAGANQIRMIRNHAQVSVANPTENEYLEVTGLAAYNTNAFGTVAPYHPEKGFNFTLEEWKDDNFVTLPANDAKLSDVTDVTTNTTAQYIFESENGIDDPVSIIIRGHAPGETENDDLYYRVMLVDEEGEQLPIRRNHHYQLNITGALSYGQDTFEEALTAAATNNVWISISDEVNEVEDQDFKLKVEQTDYVIDAQENTQSYTLTYTVTGKNGQTVDATDDKPTVTWIDNDVAAQAFNHEFTVGTDGVGTGKITVSLRSVGNSEKLEGTLLVKKGRLQRKIKIITVKKQSFTPSWVGTALYGGLSTNTTRPHVTVMFTVPETCPEELFPMKVYISVNELDIRAAAGMALDVVREGDKEWYSSGEIETEPDYKYVWTVEEPGVQRVYFESILSQDDGYKGTLHIEAAHFGTMTRTFAFTNTTRSITVEGLQPYNADISQNPDGFSKDEYVLYRLVPQKRGARVTFDLQLRLKPENNPDEDLSGDPINAQGNAEFLLYSQNLNYLRETQGEVEDYDCEFEKYADASDAWWRANNPEGGRMMMFRPRADYLTNGEFVKPGADVKGKYSVYLYTNKAKSDEVIRIASNLRSYPAVIKDNANDLGNYIGNEYRSVTFELANYNPFRFGARVKYGDNGIWQGADEEPDRSGTDDIPETVTPLTWTYEPDQPVDIAFDLTSFKGSDGNSVHPFKDEDFEIYGSTFDIYIDAPMLEIDESRLSQCKLDDTKLKADPTVPGRFIYTASRDRDTERAFGTNDVANEDKTEGADQSGERKTLPFRVKTPVSAGDIVISSDQDQVVFYSKTFSVTNSSITGTLQYNDNGTIRDVPVGEFVAFERVSNNSRIGSVTVTADGQYELRLRKEYAFNWYTDQVQFHYELNGTIYHGKAGGGTLSALFGKKDIILQPEN
ncbi:hypothetical protein [Bacteroides sp.]|uniref:hypothetical protein n=1 Tax=Bacteroides sp. TaxID=29523 RepID=UPI0025C5C2F5|nr:hypothetical protein [Bacteroides sp.]